MRKPKTAVLFLESDEILRAGAVSVLEADGRFSVGRARNAAEARLEWSLRPSVLVLPVDREAFDPYAWLALARERAGVKVLLALDPDENPAFVRPLLKRGACGYVERTSDAAKLPELLERVLLEGRVEEGGAVCRALAEYEAVSAKHASLLGLLDGPTRPTPRSWDRWRAIPTPRRRSVSRASCEACATREARRRKPFFVRASRANR